MDPPYPGPSPGPPFAGPSSAGPPKISFFSFPPKISLFVHSLGVFSLNFGGVSEGKGPRKCTFGLSGSSCETPAAHQTGPPGLAHDDAENSNVHFWRAPALHTPPKFHEKTPRESTKSEIVGGGTG